MTQSGYCRSRDMYRSVVLPGNDGLGTVAEGDARRKAEAAERERDDKRKQLEAQLADTNGKLTEANKKIAELEKKAAEKPEKPENGKASGGRAPKRK